LGYLKQKSLLRRAYAFLSVNLKNGEFMKTEYIINPMSGLSIKVKKHSLIEIIDIEGRQVVDFFALNTNDQNEFLSTGVTIDCNESLKVHLGSIIYTNLYNKMFTIIEDDVGEHDLLHPCCRPEMFDFFYNNGTGHSNCLDNINNAFKKLSFGKKTEIIPFNIFMHTKIMPDGKISVETPLSKPGDKIVLRAEMDVVLGVASCSVSESKCNGGRCRPIKVIVEEI